MPQVNLTTIDFNRLNTDPVYAQARLPGGYGLSRLHWAALMIGVQCDLDQRSPSISESHILKSFITAAQANLNLNAIIKQHLPNIQKDLRHFMKSVRDDCNVPARQKDQSVTEYLNSAKPFLAAEIKMNNVIDAIVKSIAEFTYRTRHRDQSATLFLKVLRLNQLHQTHASATAEEKLTLREMGMVHDLAQLAPMIQRFQATLFASEHQSDLIQQVPAFEALYQRLENNFLTRVIIPPGTIAFRSREKLKAVLGHVETSSTLVTDCVSNVMFSNSHVSTITGIHGKFRESHLVNTGYHEQSFGLKSYLYNDLYRLQLDTLITPQYQNAVIQKFGEERWRGQLNYLYKQIEQRIYVRQRERYTLLETQKSHYSIIATHPLGETIGHTLLTQSQDLEKDVHRKIFNEAYKTEACTMLCSEFIGRTTVAALIELNQHLQQELSLSSDATVVRLPISNREALNYLTPDRFLQVLERQGCVEKLPLSPSLASDIQEPPLKPR